MAPRATAAAAGRDDGGEAGSADVVGCVYAALVLAVVVVLAMLGGRVGEASTDVAEAARDAARAASLERSPAAARAAAAAAASSVLDRRSVACRELGVEVDAAAFVPGGSVGVRVGCAVELSDLGLVGLSGTRTFEARAAAPVDLYRGVLG